MRILVIDDAPFNQASACETLAGHDLTVLGTVEEAMELFKKLTESDPIAPFDVVLTDLYLPPPTSSFRWAYSNEAAEMFEGWEGAIRYADQLPAGLVFAIAAKNLGTKHVVIVSDTNHHADRLCAVMDLIPDIRRVTRYTGGIMQFGGTRMKSRPDGGHTWVLYDTEEGKEIFDNEKVSGAPLTRYRTIKDWGAVLETLLKPDSERKRY